MGAKIEGQKLSFLEQKIVAEDKTGVDALKWPDFDLELHQQKKGPVTPKKPAPVAPAPGKNKPEKKDTKTGDAAPAIPAPAPAPEKPLDPLPLHASTPEPVKALLDTQASLKAIKGAANGEVKNLVSESLTLNVMKDEKLGILYQLPNSKVWTGGADGKTYYRASANAPLQEVESDLSEAKGKVFRLPGTKLWTTSAEGGATMVRNAAGVLTDVKTRDGGDAIGQVYQLGDSKLWKSAAADQHRNYLDVNGTLKHVQSHSLNEAREQILSKGLGGLAQSAIGAINRDKDAAPDFLVHTYSSVSDKGVRTIHVVDSSGNEIGAVSPQSRKFEYKLTRPGVDYKIAGELDKKDSTLLTFKVSPSFRGSSVVGFAGKITGNSLEGKITVQIVDEPPTHK